MKNKKLVQFENKNEQMSFSCQDAFKSADFMVDTEKGLFSNISIITAGPVLGHNQIADEVTLEQVAKLINSNKSGIKARLTHPESWTSNSDAIEVLVGRAKNARVEGGKVKGDIQLGKYAKVSPKGNLWEYLTTLAADDPEAAGISISFYAGTPEERKDKETDLPLPPACRVEKVVGVDFVGNPAANPDGFFASKEIQRKEILMNPKLRKFLEQLGLAKDSTDAQAIEYWHGLDGKQRWVADALSEDKEVVEAKATDVKIEDVKAEAPKAAAVMSDEDKQSLILAEDQKRRTAIKALATKHKLSEKWAEGLCDRGTPLAHAEELAQLAIEMKPVVTGSGGISSGDDMDRSSLADAIGDAIMLRAGAPMVELDAHTGVAIRDSEGRVKPRQAHQRAHQFRSLPLMEMGRKFLSSIGAGVEYMSKNELVGLLFNPMQLRERHGISAFAQGTSDFPYILQNVLNKSLRGAYAEIPLDWSKFCSRMTMPDYKQFSLTSLSEAPDLVRQYEGEGIDYGTLSENRETATLAVYNKGLKLTRIAMINDDLNAFSRIPRIMGQAAARKEDDVAFAILTANSVLVQDSIALFDVATHANYITTGAAPSITTLNVGEAAMATQKGIGGASYLAIKPRTILVPVALSGTTRTLLASQYDPAASMGHVANIWAGRLEMISNPRLDAFNPAGWFLAADPGQIDTIAVVFLDEEQTPVAKQETEFDTEDLKFAVRHSVVAKAIDYRGLFYNDGA